MLRLLIFAPVEFNLQRIGLQSSFCRDGASIEVGVVLQELAMAAAWRVAACAEGVEATENVELEAERAVLPRPDAMVVARLVGWVATVWSWSISLRLHARCGVRFTTQYYRNETKRPRTSHTFYPVLSLKPELVKPYVSSRAAAELVSATFARSQGQRPRAHACPPHCLDCP